MRELINCILRHLEGGSLRFSTIYYRKVRGESKNRLETSEGYGEAGHQEEADSEAGEAGPAGQDGELLAGALLLGESLSPGGQSPLQALVCTR